MKHLINIFFISITILFSVSLNTLAQEKRIITFTNETGEPIEDVIVYFKGGNTTISNEQGVIYLNPSISLLTCHRLGYRDTVVVLQQDIPNTISLTKEAQIEEVIVAKGYNPRKHLIRLRNEAHELYKNIDTTIYYRFTIRMENPKTDEKSELQGTVRVLTRATLRWPSIFICSIDRFYSCPSMDDSLNFRFCNMRDLLNQNILLRKNFRWKNLTKKQHTYLRDWSKEDSVVFKLAVQPHMPMGINIIFSQGKLKSFEWYFKQDKGLNTRQSNLLLHAMHTFIDYSSAKKPSPSTLRRTMRYRSKSGEDWVCMVAMAEIESPCDCRYDTIDNRYFLGKPIKWQVERIEDQLQNR